MSAGCEATDVDDCAVVVTLDGFSLLAMVQDQMSKCKEKKQEGGGRNVYRNIQN